MSELDMEARRPPVVFSLFQKLKLLGAFVGMGKSQCKKRSSMVC